MHPGSCKSLLAGLSHARTRQLGLPLIMLALVTQESHSIWPMPPYLIERVVSAYVGAFHSTKLPRHHVVSIPSILVQVAVLLAMQHDVSLRARSHSRTYHALT